MQKILKIQIGIIIGVNLKICSETRITKFGKIYKKVLEIFTLILEKHPVFLRG